MLYIETVRGLCKGILTWKLSTSYKSEKNELLWLKLFIERTEWTSLLPPDGVTY